jgi:hypothetical protein
MKEKNSQEAESKTQRPETEIDGPGKFRLVTGTERKKGRRKETVAGLPTSGGKNWDQQ